MITRLTLAGALICSSVFLTGCGGWSDDNGGGTITFDRYTVELPEEYREVPPALVENKQLLNKVIKSFKVPAETPGVFEENLLVSRSEIAPDLDFEQFRTLNAQKLGTLLAGYKPGDKEVLTFSCNDRDIRGIMVTFSVQDPRYKNAQEVRLAQYQFVDNAKGYIISAAYATQKEQKNFEDIVESLGCVGTGSTNQG